MTSSSSSKDRDLKQNIGAAGQMLLSISKPVVEGIVFVLPIVIQHTRTGYGYFNQLPHNCLHFMYGTVFCFFGGMYPTLFAAIQAAEHSGRETCINAMNDLSNEITVIIEESKKDDVDMKQEKKGSDELSNKEYVTRKTKLVLQKMNPEKVNNAISSMYGVWLSVAAVLSIEFARTISFALAISDFLQKPIDRFITPTVKLVTPNEYDKWVPVIMSWITKSIAMSIAWKIQTVVSAFSSALKGGVMMAHATHSFCLHRQINPFGLIQKNLHDTYFDEILTYTFATMGLFTQFRLGFQLPRPFNFILFPFNMAEYYIRWSITKRVT